MGVDVAEIYFGTGDLQEGTHVLTGLERCGIRYQMYLLILLMYVILL